MTAHRHLSRAPTYVVGISAARYLAISNFAWPLADLTCMKLTGYGHKHEHGQYADNCFVAGMKIQ